MMIWGAVFGFIMLISFSYVVVVLANKESGNVKLLGQILAAIIALFAIVMLLYSATGKGCPMMDKMGCGTMGNDKMMQMKMK